MIFIEFTAFFSLVLTIHIFQKQKLHQSKKSTSNDIFFYNRVLSQFITFVTQEIYVVTFLKYYVKFSIFERIFAPVSSVSVRLTQTDSVFFLKTFQA